MNAITAFLKSKGLTWVEVQTENELELTTEKIREVLTEIKYDKKTRKTKVMRQLFQIEGKFRLIDFDLFFETFKLGKWENEHWGGIIEDLCIGLYEEEDNQLFFEYMMKKKSEREVCLEKIYTEYALKKIFGEKEELLQYYENKFEEELVKFLVNTENHYGRRGDLVDPLYEMIQKEMGWKDTTMDLTKVVQNIQRRG